MRGPLETGHRGASRRGNTRITRQQTSPLRWRLRTEPHERALGLWVALGVCRGGTVDGTGGGEVLRSRRPGL
jgi:hypothetical protein